MSATLGSSTQTTVTHGGDVTASDKWDPAFPGILSKAADDKLILGFVTATDLDAARAARDDAGLIAGFEFEVVEIVSGWGTKAQWEELAADDRVVRLEPDQPMKLALDTARAAANQDTAVLDAALRDAAGLGDSNIDGSGVGIAIVDSGIDGTHPMFTTVDPATGEIVSRVKRNMKDVCPLLTPGNPDTVYPTVCWVDNAPPGVPTDTDTSAAGGHGMHVASIAAGHHVETADGAYELEGFAPGSDVYGLSNGAVIVVYGSALAFNWLIHNHAEPCASYVGAAELELECAPIKVSNHSYGVEGGGNFQPGDLVSVLQDRLADEGVVTVWAAGNDGNKANFPAPNTNGYGRDPKPGILMVANYSDGDAGNRDGALNASSSRGSQAATSSWPDISAPGTNITAACRAQLPVCKLGVIGRPLDPNYGTISGTSMAAPAIAGIVALLFQANPELTPADIEDILEDTAHKYTAGSAYGADPTNPDSLSSRDKGHGLVDVEAALERALGAEAGGGSAGCLPYVTLVAEDGAGDAVFDDLVTQPILSQGGTDVRSLDLTTAADGSLVFTLGVEDLGEAYEGLGELWYVTFTLGAQTFHAEAQRNLREETGLYINDPTFHVIKGNRLDGPMEAVTGSFDDLAETVTWVVPTSMFSGAHAADMAAGKRVTITEAAGARDNFTGHHVVDRMTSNGCTYDVAQEWPSLSVGDAVVDESAGLIEVPVSLSHPAQGGESFTVTLVDGTAVGGPEGDYDNTDATFDFLLGAGEAGPLRIPVSIIDDLLDEENEALTVTISAPARARIADATGTVTIRDNDVAFVTVTDAVAIEDQEELVFGVSLDIPAAGDVELSWTAGAEGDTADAADADLSGGSLTIPAGTTSGSFTVLVNADDDFEADETLTLALEVSGGELVNDTVTGTIINDDADITLAQPSIFDAEDVIEPEDASSSTFMVFPVTLDQVSNIDAHLRVTVTSDAADDLTATSMLVTIPAGERTGAAVFSVIGDAIAEADEVVEVELTVVDDSAAAPIRATASGTIIDTDERSLSVTDAEVVEGDSGYQEMVFTITADAPLRAPATVDVATTGGDANGRKDYLRLDQRLFLGEGETSWLVSVPVVGDDDIELDETFLLALTNATGVPFVGGVESLAATGTIVNDDFAQISVTDHAEREPTAGESVQGVRIKLDAKALTDVVITVAVTGRDGINGATAGEDFVAVEEMELVIPAGQRKVAIDVTILADLLEEEIELLDITVTSVTGAVLGDASGQIAILDR